MKVRIGASLLSGPLLFVACSEGADPSLGDAEGAGGVGEEDSSSFDPSLGDAEGAGGVGEEDASSFGGSDSHTSVPLGGAGPKEPCESWTAEGGQIQCELSVGDEVNGWGDPEYVYVYIGESGSERLVIHDPDCEQDEGWNYTSAAGAPGLALCPDTCASLQAEPNPSFQAVLDCYHPSIFPEP